MGTLTMIFRLHTREHFMEKTVRIAIPTDIDVMFDIRTSVKENHLSLNQLAEMGITPETIRETILAAPCAWIAEVDGAPAGFAMADAEDGSVFAAFVRPEFEGHGIGRVLMAKAEAFLFQYHQKIWLETADASRASGFYRNLGWLPVESLPDGDIRFEKGLK
jgi:GNAT superfamily N-acetyltransferase